MPSSSLGFVMSLWFLGLLNFMNYLLGFGLLFTLDLLLNLLDVLLLGFNLSLDLFRLLLLGVVYRLMSHTHSEKIVGYQHLNL